MRHSAAPCSRPYRAAVNVDTAHDLPQRLAAAPTLLGDDPALPDGDLRPLLHTLSGARVVGLGEETHGTREVFRLKHRLFRGLVEHCGATVLLLEAGVAECEALDRYVLIGEGTAEQALPQQRFWTWDTEEVLSLVEWMRAYNAEHGPVLRLRGIDGQFPARALHEVLAVLPSPLAEEFARDLVVLADDVVVEALPHLPAEDLDRVVASASRLVAVAPDRRSRALARTVLAAARQRRSPASAVAVRDAAMAQATLAVLEEHPGQVVALWAHNGHVSREPLLWNGARGTSLGGHLAAELGESYVVVGFASGTGAVSALDADGRGPMSIPLPALPTGTLPTLVPPGIRWLDLRASGRLHTRERMIGAVVPAPEQQLRPVDLTSAYDVLVTVAEGSPSRLRPTAARQAGQSWPTLPEPDATAELAALPGGLWQSVAAPVGSCRITAVPTGVQIWTGGPWGTARVGRRWTAKGPVHVSADVRLLEGSPAVHIVVVQRDAAGRIVSWRSAAPGDDLVIEPAEDATAVSVAVASTGVGTIEVRSLTTRVFEPAST